LPREALDEVRPMLALKRAAEVGIAIELHAHGRIGQLSPVVETDGAEHSRAD
jgi:hypothetical protein